MRSTPSFALTAALLCFTLVGCGSDTHESVAEEMTGTMEELNEALAGIENKADAEAARGELASLAERMQDLETRAEALGDTRSPVTMARRVIMDLEARAEALGGPPPEPNQEITEKYGERMMEAMLGMIGEMMRLQQTDAAEVIEEILADFGGGMDGPQMDLDIQDDAPVGLPPGF